MGGMVGYRKGFRSCCTPISCCIRLCTQYVPMKDTLGRIKLFLQRLLLAVRYNGLSAKLFKVTSRMGVHEAAFRAKVLQTREWQCQELRCW